MQGENIVCFAKDWSEDPTSNNHVMRLLSRKNNVLWINSIGMRKPNLGSKADLTKMLHKVKGFAKGPVQVDERMWVFTPIVLPLPASSLATVVNQQILRASLSFLRRRLGMQRYQLWTFLPNVVEHLGALDPELVVYYCTDEFSQFTYLDGQRLASWDAELCRRADVVFTTARPLLEKRKPLNAETHLALHGVDHGHFARALAPETTIPAELAGIKGPILGFFGLIHDWIDLDLLAYVAEQRPEWTLALIGSPKVDVSRLARFPNIKLLGRKPYGDLHQYCKAFSVGLLPFAINELTRNVNPIKMREYLSAGVPVVSTDLPEVRSQKDMCRVARNKEEFLAACELAITTDTPEDRKRRSQAMESETWEAKVAELGRIVSVVRDRRRGSGGTAGTGAGGAGGDKGADVLPFAKIAM
jgi:glycosyltransferase involved in cell wall biosynthesis